MSGYRRYLVLTAMVIATAFRAGGAQTQRVTLPRLGYPDGIQLEGTAALGNVRFPLPDGTPVTGGTVTLYLDLTRGLAAGSNVQIFVNASRRIVIPAPPSSMLPLMVTIPLGPDDLGRRGVDVEVRTSFAIGRDRCMDERLASAFATILPGSQLEYDYDATAVRSPAALWTLLPDTVTVSLPAGALTTDQFERAYQLLFELRAAGHGATLVRSPAPAHLELDSAASIGELVSWRRLIGRRTRVIPNDPTLDLLGISDLSRTYANRGVWRLPLDLRMLPPDRVPTSVDLELSTAPGLIPHGVQYFVFLNGNLLQAVAAREDGQRERISVALPAYLLTTYNELRVEVQRHRDPGDYCQEPETVYPAQILGSSVVHTAPATGDPKFFTGTALRLPERFPLYLPAAALDSAELFLPTIVSLARGTWGNRSPAFRTYGPTDAVSPDSAFVVIGMPRGFAGTHPVGDDSTRLVVEGPSITRTDLGSRDGSLVVQVTRAHGQTGLLVSLPGVTHLVPDGPESYGNVDVLLQFADATTLRLNTQLVDHESLVSALPVAWGRVRLAWTVAAVAGAVVLLLGGLGMAWWRRSERAAPG